MSKFRKIKKAHSEGGFYTVLGRSINYAYELIYEYLPDTYVDYNGVRVLNSKAFEKYIPARDSPEKKDYEQGLIDAINKNVNQGDQVTILGGGLGVTAIKAAENSGSGSNITVFEGSKSRYNKLIKNAEANGYPEINVEGAIVGSEVDIWGDKFQNKISPSELPLCDVLEMDVEGSEIEILDKMTIRPDIIIVESHGFKGSSTEKVKKKLEEINYSCRKTREVPYSGQNDVKVITAEKV